jgi:hypothetical protein
MPQDLAEILSRFTPDGSRLDRDALLFAAGRASAGHARRRWMGVAGALAASQLLTLVLWWPRPAPPVEAPGPDPAPAVAVEPAPPPREAAELWVMREQALATEGNLPRPAPVDQPAPAEPPLRAFTAAPPAWLN